MKNKKTNLVWYACYGSNLAIERFLCYFNGKSNKEFHINVGHKYKDGNYTFFENKPFIIPHPIYFANRKGNTTNWGKTGVAFLDDSKKGMSYGRVYLLDKDQFEHLHNNEGTSDNWYNKIIYLGEMDGYPIITFTNKERLESLKPCLDYIDVIRRGLKEIGLNQNEIEKYFNNILKEFNEL